MSRLFTTIAVWLLPLLLLASFYLVGCSRPEPPSINLYRAIHTGDLDQIKRHIVHGTDLNGIDREGRTPLHVAVKQGNQVICRLLIEHGAKPSMRDRDGHTPLELAVLGGKVRVALLLLRKGATIAPQHLLGEVIRSGADFRDVYEFLVKQGADVNAPNAAGDTPLSIAIRANNRVAVKRLIEQGADVNRPAANGVTPLSLAQAGGNGAIVRMLHQFGAVGGP